MTIHKTQQDLSDELRAFFPHFEDGECECPCHEHIEVMHCLPCCVECPNCGRRFRWGWMEHAEKCATAIAQAGNLLDLEHEITEAMQEAFKIGKGYGFREGSQVTTDKAWRE